MGFVGGVESVLAEKSYALALQVVADLDRGAWRRTGNGPRSAGSTV